MKTIKTAEGFAIEVDEEAFDDMEVLDMLSEIEDNMLVLPKLLVKTLGKEGKKALYDYVRNDKGRVPSKKALALFEEVMTLTGEETKNS